MEKDDHKLHGLYESLKGNITGVCDFCAQAFGVKSQVEKSGLPFLNDYKNHPSLRTLFSEGYQVVTF
jgi:hypothetical protein